jgi:hypothetical protein
MHRVAVSLVVAIIAVVLAWGAGPPRSEVGASTPVAETFQAGPRPNREICDQEEIDLGLGTPANGAEKITEDPPDENGIAYPAYAPGRSLYVVEVTLPAETCVGWHAKLGAVVLFVQEGVIRYAAYSALTEATPVVEARAPGGAVQTVDLDGDPEVEGDFAVIELGEGGWVTQDRDVWFTYHNPGPDVAVVALAVDEGPDGIGDCGGGCRKR